MSGMDRAPEVYIYYPCFFVFYVSLDTFSFALCFSNALSFFIYIFYYIFFVTFLQFFLNTNHSFDCSFVFCLYILLNCINFRFSHLFFLFSFVYFTTFGFKMHSKMKSIKRMCNFLNLN